MSMGNLRGKFCSSSLIKRSESISNTYLKTRIPSLTGKRKLICNSHKADET